MLTDREIRMFFKLSDEQKKVEMATYSNEELQQIIMAQSGAAAVNLNPNNVNQPVMEQVQEKLKSTEKTELKDKAEEFRQMTLEDEIKYNSRHGRVGHDNYTKIMDQLSKEDRKKVRETYYADSDGVFSLDDLAHQKGMTFEELFFILHPEMKAKSESQTIEFITNTDTDTNEFGF